MVIKIHKLRLNFFDLENKLGGMLHPWIHGNTKTYENVQMTTFQKCWWDVRKPHHKFNNNGLTLCFKVHPCSKGNESSKMPHVHLIGCHNFYGFHQMVMGEKLVVLKCKPNCIHHKCISSFFLVTLAGFQCLILKITCNS